VKFRSWVFILSPEGIRPQREKAHALFNAPVPSNVTQLKSYLGFLNFYKFNAMTSDLPHLLYALTKENTVWEWTDICQEAFERSERAVSEKSLLVSFNPNLPLVLTCYSSQYAVGTVLSHVINGVESPISFASSTLSDSERNNSQLERMGLVLIFGVQKFHKYLFGNKFVLIRTTGPFSAFSIPKKSDQVLYL
jgi:hypothetical protein